ncbi:hypothetical protein OV208_35840 [Corallococcus sp. bb12-1]|uniref:hypothetical protein n=1 Tax=Corallococcus sp. bb12-1 TaxID=2996784 RepID=UPI00226F3556|nr:hypothetical protein [Corallococcus sp. bb12-1]MCY1046732.1 hypothetical protein [Corallococcus sp. bb12-1]
MTTRSFALHEEPDRVDRWWLNGSLGLGGQRFDLDWVREGTGTEVELLQRLSDAGVDAVHREGRAPVV